MIRTILRIAQCFCRQQKTIIQQSGLGTASVFWNVIGLNDEDMQTLLQQWDAYIPKLDTLFGNQKRYVFPQLELHLYGRIFIPKIYRMRKLSQNLIALFFSEAERNCVTTAYLHANHIRVPQPIGVLNTYTKFWLTHSVLFQEKLPETAVAYKAFLQDVAAMPSEQRMQFYSQLGQSLGRLHALGVYTEDTDQNMMVDTSRPDAFDFFYFDFDNFYPWRYPTLRRAAHAIHHYADSDHHTCSPEELDVFLNAYLLFRGKPGWREALLARLRQCAPRIFSRSACADA